MLNSSNTKDLVHLIRDSFRIRANHKPRYVEIGDSLKRFSSNQHQVVFGRRGSGKSCLFVHVLNQSNIGGSHKALYVSIDAIKRLPFPDILTRLLISIFEQLPGAKRPFYLFFLRPSKAEVKLRELRRLLDAAISSNVEQTVRSDSKASASFKSRGTVDISVGADSSHGLDTKEQFRRDKLEYLERHLEDYKQAIVGALPDEESGMYVLIDDFYLIKRDVQPDVVDYLHRLLRDTNAYLKLGTIRHRTTLRRHDNQTVGIELGQDVEEISLDKTLESFTDTQHYLVSMLDELGKAVGVESASTDLFNPDAAHALTLASGGVPRDFLNIFSDAVDLSLSKGKVDRLTPTYVYKAAAQISLPNKRKNLSEDAGVDAQSLERIFVDLVFFCLKEKRKTCFLVSRDDALGMSSENEVLQQLMDFKLIHLVATDTSAASGRAGRYSAYTLDAALFMEPRLRNIEVVNFWELNDQRHQGGVRESPIYPLERIRTALGATAGNSDQLTEVLQQISNDQPAQDNTAAATPLPAQEG